MVGHISLCDYRRSKLHIFTKQIVKRSDRESVTADMCDSLLERNSFKHALVCGAGRMKTRIGNRLVRLLEDNLRLLAPSRQSQSRTAQLIAHGKRYLPDSLIPLAHLPEVYGGLFLRLDVVGPRLRDLHKILWNLAGTQNRSARMHLA